MEKLIEMYLDYVNKFITIEKFTEYYGLDEEDALTVIELGKKYNKRLAEINRDFDKRINKNKTIILETLGKLLPNNKVKLEYSGQGFIYWNHSNFLNKKGICYIPEHGVDDEDNIERSYTYNDLLKLVTEYINNPDNEIDKKEFSPEDIVVSLFETLDWQMPETLINDWEIHGIFTKE